MDNYYEVIGVSFGASAAAVKKAFRDKAKKFHPDIAGEAAHAAMRRLLAAYEILSDPERRGEYDRAYERFVAADPRWRAGGEFDYRTFLKERVDDPKSQATLIFFDLLHLEEDEAIATWRRQGGLDFKLENVLDREDYMDCAFILAEELDKLGDPYAACMLLIDILREERRKPYFKHFTPEVETLLKAIVRTRLVGHCDDEKALECLEGMMDLGYARREQARWLKATAELLERLGDDSSAREALRTAFRRDPALPNAVQLRRRLGL